MEGRAGERFTALVIGSAARTDRLPRVFRITPPTCDVAVFFCDFLTQKPPLAACAIIRYVLNIEILTVVKTNRFTWAYKAQVNQNLHET